MKKLLSILPKKLFVAAATIGVVLGVAAVGSAALGDNRPVRPYTQGMPGFEYVTFNSFTGVPNIGDERDFFHGKISEAPNGFYDPMNGLRAGDEVLMRVYVHNNADESLNESGVGVAKNTNVRVSLPTGLSQSHQASAFISADNAQPQIIEDTISMTGEYPIQLEFVPGSARVKTNFMDVSVGDSIATTGVQIGDNALDGNLNGCFEYVALVTFKVKIKAPSYSLDKKVRLNGTPTFTESVKAAPGQKVDFALAFKNVGSTNLSNVVLGDRLPEGMTYVPGTTEWNSGHTGGQWVKVANDNLFSGGIDIGNYGPNGAGYIRFTAVIDSKEELECGPQSLVNTGFAKPKEHGAIEDKATVTTDGKQCQGPTYVCESLTVDKIGGRKVRATVKAPVTGNARVKTVSYNYGDGSTAKVTDKLVDEYTYAADGTYKITATVTFTVDGVDKVVTSDNCAKMVTFGSETPKELPNTGAGSVIGLFAATTAIGAAAHNVISRRRD